jgi:hypothetical protein
VILLDCQSLGNIKLADVAYTGCQHEGLTAFLSFLKVFVIQKVYGKVTPCAEIAKPNAEMTKKIKPIRHTKETVMKLH